MLIPIYFAAVGLLFGAGLVIAGMSDPAKVLNFLDFAAIGSGDWDPSLALVLFSAVSVAFLGFRLILSKKHPIFDTQFHLPTQTSIDFRLISGAAIFGIGWGLAGLCPGPAFVDLTSGLPHVVLVVTAMLMGMALARWLQNRSS